MAAANAPRFGRFATECEIMRATEFIVESFLGKNSRRIYDILLSSTNAGPMDGGCVVMAQAIQMKYGGEIMVLVGHPQRGVDEQVALHAVVRANLLLIDALGPKSEAEMMQRFETNELAHVGGAVTGVRPIQKNDLPDAVRDATAAAKIVTLLRGSTTRDAA